MATLIAWGKNQAWNSKTAPATTYGNKYDCDLTGASDRAPLKNLSPNNTGIKNLPRAQKPVFAYAVNDASGRGEGTGDSRFQSTIAQNNSQESSVGGQMYRYDPSLPTTGGKLPPYYEGKVLWFDWGRPGSLKWVTMNPNGTLDTGLAAVRAFAPAGLPNASYIDAQFGPEGALYMLQFTDNAYSGANQAALYRVRYTGTYDNSCFQRFTATVGTPVSISGARPSLRRTLSPAMANGIVTLPVGYRTVELYDLTGRQVWSYSRDLADRTEAVRVPKRHTAGLTRAKLVP